MLALRVTSVFLDLFGGASPKAWPFFSPVGGGTDGPLVSPQPMIRQTLKTRVSRRILLFINAVSLLAR
jgi:hypothetical protein